MELALSLASILLLGAIPALVYGCARLMGWSASQGRLADWSTVLVLIAVAQEEIWLPQYSFDNRTGPVELAVVGTTATALVQLWRRQHPLPVLGAVAAVDTVRALVGGGVTGLGFIGPVLVSAYSVGRFERLLSWPLAAGISAVLAGGSALVNSALDPTHRTDAGFMAFTFLFMAVAWAGGRMLQGREDTMQALAEHATLLERDREARVRDARREERGLIARELHDVVAHNVSVVIVQAQAASALLEHQPADARRPLERIESTAREAMAEMRRLVGILDTNDDQEERERPQPGMLQLPELIARVGEAGLHVDADLDPELEGLPAGLSLAAYRVVQEALTNVLKHANASRVRVRVRHSKTELSIAIIDNGHGLPVSGSGGRGLVGMQQRVALYGGTVDAGPRVDGGFAVNAVFPIQAEPA